MHEQIILLAKTYLNEKAGYKREPPRTKVINFERTWRCTNFALWSFLCCERMNSMHKSEKRDAFSSAESRDSHKKHMKNFKTKLSWLTILNLVLYPTTSEEACQAWSPIPDGVELRQRRRKVFFFI